MRNRYPGTCYKCGHPVAVGEGHFDIQAGKSRGNTWAVKHWWHGEKIAHTAKARKAEQAFLHKIRKNAAPNTKQTTHE